MRARRRGMSLVEVMVVIAIILTLTAVLSIGIWSIYEGARADTTMLTLGRLGQEVEVARLRLRRPLSESAGLEGLGVEVPLDDWGHRIELHVPGRGGGAYELVSLGADGQAGGEGKAADLVWEPQG